MRKKTKRLSRFMKKQDKAFNSSVMTSQPVSQSFKLYRSIHQLPLNRFITCICDGDLSALIIEGEPVETELSGSWETIYSEYLDAVKDDNLQYVDKLTKDYNLLSTKVNVIKLLIDALSYAPVDYLIEDLKWWYELPIALNPKDKTGFKRDLAVINARNQRWLNDALQLEKQIEKLQPAAGDVKITREWFDKQIVSLSRYSKYHINKNETTVSEFVIMINDLKAAADSIQNQFSKN